MANIDLGERYTDPTTGAYPGSVYTTPSGGTAYIPAPAPPAVINDPLSRRVPTGGGSGSYFPESAISRPYGGTSTGSSGVMPRQTGGTATMERIAPNMARPELAATPAVDEARIRRLTQTRSAAGQRALRAALREQILSASYQENPNVAAMISRKAMEGFGQGIAETYTRAQREATAEEYRDRQTKIQRDQAVFNAAMQDYMARFGTKTTSTMEYSDVGGVGGGQAVPFATRQDPTGLRGLTRDWMQRHGPNKDLYGY